jgi:predicted NUDIX family phosphoesterase
MDERVLCLPARAVTHYFGAFNGCIHVSEEGWQTFFDAEEFRFRPRREVEDDPSWRQIIPYVMLCCSHGDAQLILCSRRKGDETRLHGLISAGFGGHVSDTDGCAPASATRTAMWRELKEELPPLVGHYHRLMESLGFAIIDNTTPVGRVHVGICTRMAVLSRDLFEELVAQPGCFDMEVGALQLDECEPWTQHMLRAFYPEDYPCV